MNYKHVAAGLTAGALVTPNPCKLHSVTINTKGAGANVLTLYDNALGDNSGNVIAIIDTVNINSQTLLYDVETFKGLSYSSAAGTGADITFAYQ